MNERLAAAIVKEAQRIGAKPEDFATVISFETGGTFDPWQKGPTTKYGVHRGLIQMGEPQREQFGYREGMPIEDAVRASADYLVANGFQPGMSGAQLYATINTGSPNKGHLSDTAAGGTWGSADDKWNHQMEGHREKALGLLAGTYIPPAPGGYDDDEMGSQPGSTQIDAGAYLDVGAPTGPDMFQQLEAEKAAPQPYESWMSEIGASFNSGITAAAIRHSTEGQIDLDFRIGEERAAEITKSIPEDYHDMVLGAGSESVLQSRLQWIGEDMERQQKLAAGGWSATGAGLVAGVLDPIPLAAGVATGGFGILARGGLAARAAVGAGAGAASNAAIDYAAQELFDDPYADPVMAGIVGAGFGTIGGALARNRAAQDIAEVAYQSGWSVQRAARDLRQSTALTPEGQAVLSSRDGSMGAASNTDLMDNLIPDERAYLGEIADGDVPRAFGGKARFDVAGQMTTASDPLARVVGFNFFDDVAGTTTHSVTPFSANTRQTATHRQELGNFNAGFVTSRFEWLKESGISRMKLVQRAKAIEDFNAAVRDYVLAPIKPEGVSPHVVKAAGAWQRMADNYRQRLNSAGMSNLDANPNYVPMVSDIYKVARIDRDFHPEAIESMIEAAIRKHSPTLSPEVLRRMSKGYWANLRKGAYGVDDGASSAVHRGDRDAFYQAINENLSDADKLDDVELDGLWRALGGSAEQGASAKGVAYLKKRTLMDYTESFRVKDRQGNLHTMRVADFFEADLEVLARRYSRIMSGRVAFAETKIINPSKGELIADGIRSEADLNRLKEMVIESYRKSGRPLADYQGELKNQLENIDFGWKRINGIPVWNNASGFNQWARRIKTSQFVRLMSNMGLNQFQEGWKVMALTGFKSSLSQLPAIKTMLRGVHNGKFDKDKLLTELTDMTGFGMDGMGSRIDFRLDDDRIGSTVGGKFTRSVDNFLDASSAITAQISLMRSIQEFQQRWALKAITQQMAHIARKTTSGDAFDLTKIKPRDRQRLASLGIGDDEAKSLFNNLLRNAEFDGNKIVGMGLDKWDADAVTLYRHYLGRYVDRLVQQNDYGALSKWMSHPVGSMFIQFRSFVFGAWAKSTLWSANHMDPKMLVLLLGEIAMGSATFMVRNSHLLATEEGREKWQEQMTAANLLKNGWARSATASTLPMFLDSFLMFTPAGPQFGNARSSGSPTDAVLGMPAVDQLKALKTFSSGAMRSAFGDDEMTAAEQNAGIRALPLPANWLPLTATLGALIKQR